MTKGEISCIIKTTQQYISIQLLRAIAALSVVYVHCTTAGDYNLPSTGRFGVDIFFIISGFIIAFMVTRNTEQFFVKRIIRIVPLYALATIVMTLTVVLFPNLICSTTVSLSGFIKSVLFIPRTENRGQPILGQGWTLNYEMFFYLVMYLCITFIKNKKYLTGICASVLVFIVVLAYLTGPSNYFLNYYGKGLFPEFIYGMILYHCYNYFNKKGQILAGNAVTVICLSVLAIISYGFMVFCDVSHFNSIANRNISYGIPALVLVTSLLFLENNIKINRTILVSGKFSNKKMNW